MNNPENTPQRIGLTGGIGSGKSYVAHILRAMNFPIYDADQRARELMSEDPELRQKIAEQFGPESYHPDGAVNRPYLAENVFPSEEATQKLSNLVHPVVGRDFDRWAQTHPDAELVFLEAALLIENGRYQSLDKLLLVWAPEELRIERVLARDPQRTEAQVREIIARQMPEKAKKAYADCLIANDGRKLVLPQLLEWLKTCTSNHWVGV